jgi:hypothetical protein
VKKKGWLEKWLPSNDPINPESFGKIDYLCGLLVLFISFGVYLWTMAPTVTFGDSGDFISSAYTLGLPHPTGYPTYILLAHLISYLPIGNIAFRINLLSSFFASLAVMMAYFITRKVTSFNHEGLKGRKNPQITEDYFRFQKDPIHNSFSSSRFDSCLLSCFLVTGCHC